VCLISTQQAHSCRPKKAQIAVIFQSYRNDHCASAVVCLCVQAPSRYFLIMHDIFVEQHDLSTDSTHKRVRQTLHCTNTVFDAWIDVHVHVAKQPTSTTSAAAVNSTHAPVRAAVYVANLAFTNCSCVTHRSGRFRSAVFIIASHRAR